MTIRHYLRLFFLQLQHIVSIILTFLIKFSALFIIVLLCFALILSCASVSFYAFTTISLNISSIRIISRLEKCELLPLKNEFTSLTMSFNLSLFFFLIRFVLLIHYKKNIFAFKTKGTNLMVPLLSNANIIRTMLQLHLHFIILRTI